MVQPIRMHPQYLLIRKKERERGRAGCTIYYVLHLYMVCAKIWYDYSILWWTVGSAHFTPSAKIHCTCNVYRSALPPSVTVVVTVAITIVEVYHLLIHGEVYGWMCLPEQIVCHSRSKALAYIHPNRTRSPLYISTAKHYMKMNRKHVYIL